MWILVGVMFAVLIGLRHEVGGDWFNYLPQFYIAGEMKFSEVIQMADPGHWVLNMWVSDLGGDIHAVNMIYSVVLMSGGIGFSVANSRSLGWPCLSRSHTC